MKYFVFFLIFASIACGCYRESDYDPANNDIADILKISVTKSSIPADSASLDTIYLRLGKEIDSAHTFVKVTTTSGTFLESGTSSYSVHISYSADSLQYFARITLRSSTKVDSALLRFDYETTSRYASVTFKRAYPEALKLTTSSLLVKPVLTLDGEITITSQLTRTYGTPSQKSDVQVKVYDSLYRRELGIFRIYNNLSDNNGFTSFKFNLADSNVNSMNYYGSVNIIGKTLSSDYLTYAVDTLQIFSVK